MNHNSINICEMSGGYHLNRCCGITHGRKVAKKVLSGLILFASVLVIILGFLTTTWYVRRQQPTETSLCFHEDVWMKYGYEISELLKKLTLEYQNGTNGKHYCVKAFEAFKYIASKQLNLRYDTELNPEPPLFNLTFTNCTITQGRPALLHLTDIKRMDTKGMSSIIIWKTFMSDGDGLRYLDEDGLVTIQKSGFYHISTQLTIMREHNATFDEGLKFFVMRFSDTTKKESVLLENPYSTCQLAVEQCKESSNMGSAFDLAKNDKIYVAVSHPNRIVFENGQQLFSIYEI